MVKRLLALFLLLADALCYNCTIVFKSMVGFAPKMYLFILTVSYNQQATLMACKVWLCDTLHSLSCSPHKMSPQ